MLLAYGNSHVDLKLPSGVRYDILSSSPVEPLADPIREIRRALAEPIGTGPLKSILKPGETVCIIVNDTTRISRSDIFLPPLLETIMDAGIRREDTFILFANGSHRLLEMTEMVNLVGDKVAADIALYNHDCDDESNLIYLGSTSRGTPLYINKLAVEADWRILTGSVLHDYFAGFGGGRKALVPGVAGRATIEKNHSLLLEENAETGRLDGNPLHEDLLEGANKLVNNFLINTVLNENKEILGVFAGDMVEAHLEACDLVMKANGVSLERLADVVIASCGGHPKDINLYQAHKSLDNGISALKPGGRMALLARCPEGIGSEKFEQWIDRCAEPEKLEASLRRNFVLGGHKAFTVSRLLRNKEVYLVSDLDPDKVRAIGFIPVKSVEEAVKMLYRGKSDLYTCIMPQASTTVPEYRGAD